MSAADELRAAAVKVEALAKSATPGQWTCYGDHLVWPSEQGPAANDPILAMVGEAHQDSAAYIAAMHPGVGLALAAWLRKEADGFDLYEATMRLSVSLGATAKVSHSTHEEALDLARAINGGTP